MSHLLNAVPVLAALVATTAAVVQPTTLRLTSPAFANNASLPLAYTGYGDFKSPPLAWSGVPKGTRELALVVTDPDVPLERFETHWLLYNIPAATTRLPEMAPDQASREQPSPIAAASQGVNALKRIGYLPPRPFTGSGLHHYTFTLYALDADLPLNDGLTKEQLLAAMKGHILAETALVAVFEWKEP